MSRQRGRPGRRRAGRARARACRRRGRHKGAARHRRASTSRRPPAGRLCRSRARARDDERLRLRSRLGEPALDEQNVEPLLHGRSRTSAASRERVPPADEGPPRRASPAAVRRTVSRRRYVAMSRGGHGAGLRGPDRPTRASVAGGRRDAPWRQNPISCAPPQNERRLRPAVPRSSVLVSGRLQLVLATSGRDAPARTMTRALDGPKRASVTGSIVASRRDRSRTRARSVALGRCPSPREISPGSRRSRPSPVRNACGGQVIGSTPDRRARCPAGRR